MRKVLANRDGRLYLAGQIISTLGDSALWLAMGILVKLRTGSSSAAGLVFFAFIAGTLLAPLTGLLADRVRRRPLLLAANLATGALVCLLLLAGGRAQIWVIYPVMFAYGVANSLLSSAGNALLAALFPAEDLGDANALLQMASQGLRVVSPLLGAGLLVAAGPVPVIALDAGTFVVAAGTLAAIRVAEPAPEPGASRWRAEVSAGMRHVAGTPALRRLMIAGIAAASMFGFFETVPYSLVSQGLHRSPGFVGVLNTVVGVGALIGGAVAAPVMRRVGERTLVAFGLLACGLTSLLLIAPWLPSALLAAALLGVCLVWVNVGVATLLQRRTPADLLGRVGAALDIAVTTPQAASIAVGAALIAVADYRVLLGIMAAVLSVAAGYLAVLRENAVEAAGAGAGAPGTAAGRPQAAAAAVEEPPPPAGAVRPGAPRGPRSGACPPIAAEPARPPSRGPAGVSIAVLSCCFFRAGAGRPGDFAGRARAIVCNRR